MKIFLGIFAVLALFAFGLYLISRRGPDLKADYQRQLQFETASDLSRNQPIVTEENIALLPAPVQRYLRMNGSIGKPRVSGVHLTFDAEMFQKKGQAGMRGQAEQYDRVEPPKRLFFMQTKMYGLPVDVLHDYKGSTANMRVRLASLYNVVDINSREDLSKTETVTLLNDLCLFMPSWLTDERLTWQPIDDQSAKVSFANGPHKVTATVYFNAQDELVNFVSEDRGALQDDGTLRILRWSTPMRDYKEFDGRRFATVGEAIWHYPEGDFVYGKMTLTKVFGK
jgi:hypothetical protein